MTIAFENVSFRYADGRGALEQVSFTIQPDETIAIVGENGAGKTTLVKLLMRLYDPTEGAITVGGIDLRDLDLVQWRRQIGVIFQDYGRYSLTIRENIGVGDLDVVNDEARQQAAAEKAGLASFIAHLPHGYDTMLGKQFGGTELSGGQWQKLSIARAFARESQIFILDEPTAALDPRSEYEIYQHFTELTRGKTTLLITHRLASVRMAHRILVFKDGQLNEMGTHAGLLARNGEYAALWQMQAERFADTASGASVP